MPNSSNPNGVTGTKRVGDGNPFGYGEGDGSTVTQLTSITTGVEINKPSGQITTVSQTIVAGESATFTVTNSEVAAVDTVEVNLGSTSSAGGPWSCFCSATAAGSFDISVHNINTSTDGDNTLTINYNVIKGSAS